MKNTKFTNSTGWPDPDLSTTAHDLALLSTALIKNFPVINIQICIPFSKENLHT